MCYLSTANAILNQRVIRIIIGIFLGLFCLSAEAIGLDQAGRQSLAQFQLSDNILHQVLEVTRQAQTQGIKTNDSITASEQTLSIAALAENIKNQPKLMAILSAHHLTPRTFMLGDLALMQAVMASQPGMESQLAQRLFGNPNKQNLTFYQDHKSQVDDLLSLANGESTAPMTASLSEQDKKQLAKFKALQHNGEFKQCLKVSTVVPSVTYPFSVAAATSHYNVPNVKLEPQTLTKSAKILDDLSANVDDQLLSDNLYQLSRQIALQEGHNPIQITEKFKAALAAVNQWLTQHCTPPDDSAAKHSTDSLAPTTRSVPVASVNSDAPGILFSHLSANDAAILLQAKGIQTGPDKHNADIQVIFDPNGPYAAKLYRLLKSHFADQTIRWVPVAYMTASSKQLTATLLKDKAGQQKLDVDLMHYNNRQHHGGLHVNHNAPSTLPAVQQRLFKAMEKWGGYTPMLIFRDTDGRWLQTGGSSAKVIRSILARHVRAN